MNALVLLGPPGAGKGTVANVLVDKGYKHISTGDILRKQIRMETPVGREAGALIDRGRFVSDAVAVDMIQQLLDSSEPSEKFLLDGFPRTLKQAESFEQLIFSHEVKFDGVILLKCSPEILVERISGRRTCEICGTVYHVKFNPPSRGDVCDIDGSKLVERADDNGEILKERIEVYLKRTAPLVEFYKNRNLLYPIDASMSIEEVRNAVREYVSGH